MKENNPLINLLNFEFTLFLLGTHDYFSFSNCCTQTTEKPYLRHRMAKTISNFKFCPYEDVLGIGTSKGFTSIIVPGKNIIFLLFMTGHILL